MSVKLQRGGNVSLDDLQPVPGIVVAGLGWKLLQGRSRSVELVPSAILCGADGHALSPEHLVFFNQMAAPDGAVRIVSADDEEQIEIDLRDVPDRVEKIVLVVYIDPDLRSPGTFASVRNAHLRILDRADTELVRYDLDVSESGVNAMIFGELYRHRGSWKVRAVGQGFTSGIRGVGQTFGLDL